ncbi:Uncharacterised protein [Burkholderia pseudomallei]|nr:Uncharacterised protein [Burkholderia pseudomallei]
MDAGNGVKSRVRRGCIFRLPVRPPRASRICRARRMSMRRRAFPVARIPFRAFTSHARRAPVSNDRRPLEREVRLPVQRSRDAAQTVNDESRRAGRPRPVMTHLDPARGEWLNQPASRGNPPKTGRRPDLPLNKIQQELEEIHETCAFDRGRERRACRIVRSRGRVLPAGDARRGGRLHVAVPVSRRELAEGRHLLGQQPDRRRDGRHAAHRERVPAEDHEPRSEVSDDRDDLELGRGRFLRISRPAAQARAGRLHRARVYRARLLSVGRAGRGGGAAGREGRVVRRRLGVREHARRSGPARGERHLVRRGALAARARAGQAAEDGGRAVRLGRSRRSAVPRPIAERDVERGAVPVRQGDGAARSDRRSIREGAARSERRRRPTRSSRGRRCARRRRISTR